ncbi:MAG: AAA family ATPase [Patescibacteria group bacterium]
MKLLRIKTIKGYKSFYDFSWQPFLNSENFHEDINIIYGENGSGKSTICNLLKNISDNKSFGKYRPTEICLSFDIGDRKYPVNNDWDKKVTKDSILFFDREFVDKNVHLGSRRDTTQNGQEQVSGKMIIEFDCDAINLREVKDKAKKAKEEQDQKIKEFSLTNKDILAFNLSDEEELCYQSYKDKDEEEINKKKQDLSDEEKEIEKNLETDQVLQKKVSNIQSDISIIPKVEVEVLLSNYEAYRAIFDFDLKEQVKIEAEQALIDKIKTHKHFFDAGLEIRKIYRNECPFCQSKNEEGRIEKIVDLYGQIYDITYQTQTRQFGKDKQNLADELLLLFQTISDFDLNSIFIELKRLDQNYKVPNIYSVDDEIIYKKPRIQEINKLRTKIIELTKPSKEDIQELYDKVLAEFEEVEKYFQAVNDFVEKKNKLIVEFKIENTDEKIKSRLDINIKRTLEIDKELNFINRNKIKEQKKKEDKEKELRELQAVFNILKTEHEIALREYEDHCSTKAFSNLLSKIQDYFKNFNFSFKLKLKTDPTGNKTEFPFAFKVLDLEDNERDFKEGLSEGEVQVLSLCFFFAFLDIQKDKNIKILVFDDPITSLDNNNLSCLVDLIAEEYKVFSQVFVFTHHKAFFKFLRKRFDKHCQEYNLIRNKKELGGSFVCRSKIDKFLDKLKNFETDLKKIPPASLDIELKTVEYGQYLRYEVERYIKNNLLHWNANDFSSAIDGVKENKEIDDSDLDKIKQIYSFCNWTTSHVDVGDDYGLEQLKVKINDFTAIVK